MIRNFIILIIVLAAIAFLSLQFVVSNDIHDTSDLIDTIRRTTKQAPPDREPTTLTVPDDYQTIQEAIDNSIKGDTIFIKAGEYKGKILFRDGIKLIGQDRDKVIIRLDAHEKHVIYGRNFTSGTISDITIEHTGKDESEKRYSGIYLENSSIEITRCRIRNAAGHGIRLLGKDTSLISDCIIESSGFAGIYVDGKGAQTKIINNTVKNNSTTGICFTGGGLGTVEGNICVANKFGIGINGKNTNIKLTNNRCEDNLGNGITVWDSAEAMLDSNSCENNKGCGIIMWGGSKALVENNVCINNGKSGIKVYDSGSSAVLNNNTFAHNKEHGIYFSRDSYGKAEGNICTENEGNGITVRYGSAAPELLSNKCTGNKLNGIEYKGGMGIATGNACDENQKYGISLSNAWSCPKLTNNSYNDNQLGTIYRYTPPFGRVRDLLLEEKFDELEEIATRLRLEKPRIETGGWQLDYFYSHLAGGWAKNYITEVDWLIESLERWKAHRPHSITPRVVLAKVYIKIGWEGRGDGWAKDVTEEGWKIFRTNLKKAWGLLKETESLKIKDPELYHVFLTVGRGLSKSERIMNDLFEKGVAIEPCYSTIYLEMAEGLLPKWGGSKRQLKALAERSLALIGGDEGVIMYAKIASEVMPTSSEGDVGRIFKSYGFSYDTIKKGFSRLLMSYPDSKYYRNRYCLIASIYKDRETAIELFDQIGDDWHRGAWRNEENFTKYQKWAYERK